jgi:hypothetical protein
MRSITSLMLLHAAALGLASPVLPETGAMESNLAPQNEQDTAAVFLQEHPRGGTHTGVRDAAMATLEAIDQAMQPAQPRWADRRGTDGAWQAWAGAAKSDFEMEKNNKGYDVDEKGFLALPGAEKKRKIDNIKKLTFNMDYMKPILEARKKKEEFEKRKAKQKAEYRAMLESLKVSNLLSKEELEEMEPIPGYGKGFQGGHRNAQFVNEKKEVVPKKEVKWVEDFDPNIKSLKGVKVLLKSNEYTTIGEIDERADQTTDLADRDLALRQLKAIGELLDEDEL